ncbi:MAG: phosphoribosylglycinamide formyltransferase [Planctomycetota bacterium]
MTIRLGVLVSGGGTTLQNFLDRIQQGRLDAEVAVVLASSPKAFGLERARRAGIPAFSAPAKLSPKELGEYLFHKCRNHDVDLVCMAGFLKLIEIPGDFTGRVMNIHPALIPAFAGKGYHGHHVHEAVLARGVKLSGCTVHFADNQYDHGPIILQRAVPVLEDDTPDTLAARVFEAECDAYPDAINLFAQNRLRIEGQRVRVL